MDFSEEMQFVEGGRKKRQFRFEDSAKTLRRLHSHLHTVEIDFQQIRENVRGFPSEGPPELHLLHITPTTAARRTRLSSARLALVHGHRPTHLLRSRNT